jgi:hypothetical protein
VDDPSLLLDYYFGRGERLVVVEIDGITQEGLLDTRWLSADRVWWVQITQVLTSVPSGSTVGDAHAALLEPPQPTRTPSMHISI